MNPLSFSDLLAQLDYCEDIFERAQMPYVLDGVTLTEVVLDNTLVSPLEFGVRDKDVTRFSRNTLSMFFEPKYIIKKGGVLDRIIMEKDGLPITIYVHYNDPFLENPDTITMWYSSYKVPNPVGEYLNQLQEAHA